MLVEKQISILQGRPMKINGLSSIAIIPARGGSKGIPKKNIVKLGQLPLIAYTIKAAQESQIFDHIVVSSDSEEILTVAEEYGALPLLRSPELALDESSCNGYINHVLKSFSSCELIAILQPTSPLRSAIHIKQACDLFIRMKPQMVVSTYDPSAHPLKSYLMQTDGFLYPVEIESMKRMERRQDLPRIYAPNGAIYIFEKTSFLETGALPKDRIIPYEMPAKDSIDIDNYFDLKIAEFLLMETP